jgi:hypothetical protein
MAKYRCTVTGGSDEQTRRGGASEIFEDVYTIEAESSAEAKASARQRFERERGQQPTDEPVCELESLVAIREATESDVADPGRRMRLEQAAVKDGGSMEDLEAARRSNPHWRPG